MTRFVYATLTGLCGAVAVHLVIIFALPASSPAAPWQVIYANTQTGVTSELVAAEFPASAAVMIDQLDPFMHTLVCRYDLREGVMHMRAPRTPLAWSAAIFDSQGLSFFSINDRIAARRMVDLVVTGQTQERRVRQEPPAAFEDAIIVPSNALEGFAVIRLFVPDETWAPLVRQFARGLRCETVSLAF